MFRPAGNGDVGVKVVVDFGGKARPTKVSQGPRLNCSCSAHQREQGLCKIYHSEHGIGLPSQTVEIQEVQR